MSTRRDRKPVSCGPCRRRKLKCDRAVPACGSCLRRDNVTSCTYQEHEPGSQRRWPVPNKSTGSIENRMERMEQLIITMMNSNSHTDSAPVDMDDVTSSTLTPKAQLERVFSRQPRGSESPCPDSSPEQDVLGPEAEQLSRSETMRIGSEHGGCFRVGEAHWAMLLSGIAEVRHYLEAQTHQNSRSATKATRVGNHLTNSPTSLLLLGVTGSLSRQEILLRLPPRHICDVLVARYFYTLEPALYILHVATFHRQYVKFEVCPDSASTAWVGLLCAVMRVAALSWRREGVEPPDGIADALELSNTLRSLATNALRHADYAHSHGELVEALVLHLNAEYISVREANHDVYILVGTIIRVAMKMGYHRSSRATTGLSPFQEEMRRRVWAHICMADVLFSFQAGLPSMIRVGHFDQDLPRNIHDDAAFYETCQELPPARPDSEITQVSFLIIKSRMTAGFARALEELNGPIEPAYDRVLELDRELRHLYEGIPEYYKLKALTQMMSDPLHTVASRFMLANILHKSICVVHSRFLEAARKDICYVYSRRACLESAIRLLSFQALQHELTTRSVGALHMKKYQTSLTTHDFLLGATIICAELSLTHNLVGVAQRKDSGPTRNELLMALRKSAQIWHQMRNYSTEARKASDVLAMLCLKFEKATQSHLPPGRRERKEDDGYSRTRRPAAGREPSGGLEETASFSECNDMLAEMTVPPTASYPRDKPIIQPQDETSTVNLDIFSDASARMLGMAPLGLGPLVSQIESNPMFAQELLPNLTTSLSQPETDWTPWSTTMPTSDRVDPFNATWSFNLGKETSF